MAKLVYNFKSNGLNDFPVEFKLEGIDREVTVDIEVSDSVWTIASITGDLKTALRVSMTADIAACDTVLAIGAENLSTVQKAYGTKSPWGLNELFKDAVERAIETYCEACSKLADKLRNENKKLEQL